MSKICSHIRLFSQIILRSAACLVAFFIFTAVAYPLQSSTFVVNTLADHDDGVCDANDCTLREAIKYAPAGFAITFSVTGTITLTQGNITIANSLTITGPASAPGITVSGNNANRIFYISSGTITLSALTISGGNEKGLSGGTSGYGGGVYIGGGTLTIDNCTVSGNTAVYNGGGIYNAGGTVTVTGSTISGNFAYRDSGGIHNSASMTVLNSTISGNISNDPSEPSGGGGISNFGGILTVTNSTLTNNTSRRYGGGIYNNSGTVTMTNSTLFYNHAPNYYGGGIYNGGTLTVTSSTISSNNAFSTGGGIANNPVNGTLNVYNSIVAGNSATTGPDIAGTVASGDYNLVQNTAGATLSGSHNITGVDPQLDTLKDNGGPTMTMALKAGSYAINTGDPNFDTAAIPYDQRGSGYPRKVSSAVDIGAYESSFTSHALLASNMSFSGSRNSAFSGQLMVSGGDPGNTLTYSIVSGTLPDGLTLDSATGIISGTPTAYGSSTLTYKVTDNNGGVSNTATVTINITERLSLVVTTNSDTTNSTDELTSLREAVAYAESGNAGANPVITFNVTGIIEMKYPSLSITRDITINGPGASSLTLSGNGNDGVSYNAASLFNISGGNVSISGLTLRDGTGTSAGNNTTYGGAIYQTGGTVTVTSSILSNNNAQYGGAVYVSGGSLTITGDTISGNNITAYNSGGGIAIGGGIVAITNSTISGNTAGFGAGIYSAGGTLSLTNSTISGNTAQNYTGTVTIVCSTYEQCQNPPAGFTCNFGTQTCTGTVSNNGRGGGIFNVGGTVNITNSTISGNTAQGYDSTINYGGGGIDNRSNLTIANSTITNNSGQYGGGIQNRGTLNLSNSIVAGNTASASGADIFNYPNSSTSGNYNLVQNGDAVPGTGNITGQDPKLDTLKNNGGPTQTHALLVGSPAVDAGDPNFDITNLPYDQRGAGFPRVVNGRVDIGAFEGFEYQNNLVVNTLADHDDGLCDQSDCTLREAVKYAAAPGAIVTFGVSGTITLTQGEIVLVKNISINGPTTAPGITISGSNQSRIFSVGSGNILNLSNLTLTKGNGVGATGSGNGGAIYSSDTVSVTNCTFTANAATGNGGAIRNSSTLTVTNSTFSGNTASAAGGAIQFSNRATITSSTISDNTAGTLGGGINNNSGAQNQNPVILSNSIVAGNSAPTGPDFAGAVSSGDYNLVQNASGATLSGTHNITGQPALLAPLAYNGGATQTRALLFNSPALDAGNDTAAATDQRGLPRPFDLPSVQNGSGNAADIGAYEAQTAPAAPTAATVSISGRATTLSGRGITGVILSLTDSNGNVRTATTTSFGYYQFIDVEVGETYILAATGKHYTFSQPVQVLNVSEETNQIDFIANSEKKTRSF